jgi:hypothetical protein
MKRSICPVLVLLCGAAAGFAAPRPAIVQGPQQWTARVMVEPLRMVVLPAAREGSPGRYWYVVLSVENTASRAIDLYLQADLLTDSFDLVPADRSVPPEVFRIVKARHAGTYPFLEDLPVTGTRILQGPDHVRDFAVIWPDLNPEVKAVSLFIGGMSNETVAIDHPTAKDPSGTPTKVFLKKTLQLDFTLKGESDLRGDENVQLAVSRWVMR